MLKKNMILLRIPGAAAVRNEVYLDVLLDRLLPSRPPRGMNVGSGVVVKRPHRISHSRFIHVGDNTLIHQNALIAPIPAYAGVTYHPEVRIGRDVYIGPNLFLACIGNVSIGDGSVLSESVFINDSNHGLDPESGPIMNQVLTHKGDIIIGKSCFLGLRCAILPGVVLGDHCVVGVNSVVTRSFPAYSMLVGSPARVVRRYDTASKSWVGLPGEVSGAE